MSIQEAIKQTPKDELIAISFEDGGYSFYDPKKAQTAREAEAARRIRLQEIFAEDHKVLPTWVATLGKALQAVGKSRIGRALLGWMDTALFILAVHVVPVLWLLDELRQKDHASSLAMFHITMRDIYQGSWFEGHRMVNPTGFFRRHPLWAVAVGAAAFILSSPMLIVSVPVVVAAKIRGCARIWARRRRITKARV